MSTANRGYGTSTVAGSQGSYSAGGASSTAGYASNGGTQCGPTCEICCLVEVPGETVDYRRKVMTQPAMVVRTPVAPQYQSITKQVLADPGGVETIDVLAQYRDITINELVRPAAANEFDVPAKMARLNTRELVSPESYSWARVICNTGQVVGHSGPVNYQAASGYSGGYSGVSQSTGGYSQSHSSAHHDGLTQSGSIYDSGGSGITYGGQTSTRYSAKQPSALIYGSSNSQAPDYGISYNSPSQPRIYGGEGMNSHHSAGH